MKMDNDIMLMVVASLVVAIGIYLVMLGPRLL